MHQQAKDCAAKLGSDMIQLTLAEFLDHMCQRFYQNVNIDLMKYLLDITLENDFCIHHSELINYGVMSSTQSSHMRKRLNHLLLKENVDYKIKEGSPLSPQRGGHNKKNYYLNPNAFKKCITRAKRCPEHTTDPVDYCDNYIALENICGLYIHYQELYNKKIIETKDSKINELLDKIKELTG